MVDEEKIRKEALQMILEGQTKKKEAKMKKAVLGDSLFHPAFVISLGFRDLEKEHL